MTLPDTHDGALTAYELIDDELLLVASMGPDELPHELGSFVGASDLVMSPDGGELLIGGQLIDDNDRGHPVLLHVARDPGGRLWAMPALFTPQIDFPVEAMSISADGTRVLVADTYSIVLFRRTPR